MAAASVAAAPSGGDCRLLVDSQVGTMGRNTSLCVGVIGFCPGLAVGVGRSTAAMSPLPCGRQSVDLFLCSRTARSWGTHKPRSYLYARADDASNQSGNCHTVRDYNCIEFLNQIKLRLACGLVPLLMINAVMLLIIITI